MPALDGIVGVEQSVCGHDLRAQNLCRRGSTEDPGQEVPPTGKPAADATVSSCCDGCPVVDCRDQFLVPSVCKVKDEPPPDDGIDEASSARDAAMNQ